MYLYDIDQLIQAIKGEVKDTKQELTEEKEGKSILVALDRPLALILHDRLLTIKAFKRVSKVDPALESSVAIQVLLPNTTPINNVPCLYYSQGITFTLESEGSSPIVCSTEELATHLEGFL